ncbi:putative replication protein A [Nymphon striatum]|nr:putative replication protein A [Nymphon striatum]
MTPLNRHFTIVVVQQRRPQHRGIGAEIWPVQRPFDRHFPQACHTKPKRIRRIFDQPIRLHRHQVISPRGPQQQMRVQQQVQAPCPSNICRISSANMSSKSSGTSICPFKNPVRRAGSLSIITTLTNGLPALAITNGSPFVAASISFDRCVLASWMLTRYRRIALLRKRAAVTNDVTINARIRANAETLSSALEHHMLKVFAPDARKELRLFSAGEASELLGISTSFLRKLHFDGKIGDVHTTPGGRRHYSAENLLEIRHALEATAKTKGAYQRGRRPGDKLQVLSFLNFKGGSGKTTSAVHAAQRLALKGYRVLCVDIDPQASLTTLFGYRPEYDFLNSGTIYDAIRYDDPLPLSEVVQKTFFTGIDLAPGGLMLQEFEHETPQALINNIPTAVLCTAGDCVAGS